MSPSDNNDLRRAATHDIEIGVSDALQRHITRHVVPPKPVSERKLRYEHSRPRILREMLGEATGVFFYVFAGIASVASFTLATTNPVAVGADGRAGIGVGIFGSIFSIGWAFAFGIAFAIITCGQVSGGHFNPAITICFAIWQGFPWKKVPHYIFAQIFGSFMAGLLVMGMYWPEIQAAKAIDLATEGTVHFNGGVASILCTYPNANQTNQGYLFLQEWFVDSYIGIVIWAILDPANPTNLARDLGTRIVAAIFFGKEAFTVDNGYSWISILVNVPATIFATAYYEAVIRDSIVAIGQGHKQYEGGDNLMGLVRQMTNKNDVEDMPMGTTNAVGHNDGLGSGVEAKDGYQDGKSTHIDSGVVKRVNGSGSSVSDGPNGRDWA
ncbi:Aquaporin-3 [Cyphellophora attinorum]|uniref:Aquaporin-3 n=1 Tax=Cyphellophora attinorum TaxID=1664694 RepID=A0A0N1P0I9_9EURO|nr:Aquaporin-3 [Phialophora attinorum]KPI39083.1 Aquaporin-3 [Phialophora attinorum]